MEKKRLRAPSPRMIKATQLMSIGYSEYKAKQMAGYSKSYVNKGGTMKKSPTAQELINNQKKILDMRGLNEEFIGDKFKEWLSATKVQFSHTEPDSLVPDYDTQLKAYDRWDKVYHKEQSPKVKRSMTITEFIGAEEK